jgi:hypothetical protein
MNAHFPKESIPIFGFAVVIHTLLMSSGFTYFGLIIYGLYFLSLIVSYIPIAMGFMDSYSPVMSLSISFGIFACVLLLIELLRHYGPTREIQKTPSAKYVNIVIWTLSGLITILSLGFLLLFRVYPTIISGVNQVAIADTMFYVIIIFGLLYASMVTSL